MRLGLGHLALASALMVILVQSHPRLDDPDLWWHLANGRLVWTMGSVPTQDAYSFTAAGQTWLMHEWLTEALLYALWRTAGMGGLMLAFTAVTACAYLLGLAAARERGAPPGLTAWTLAAAALAASPMLGARPQMVTLAFFGLFLWLLERHRLGRLSARGRWLLPAAMVLWVNLHGGFPVGIALVGLYAALEYGQRRSAALGPALAACLAATLLNPYTYRGAVYSLQFLGDQTIHQRYIGEWASPDFHETNFRLLLALVLGAISALTFRRPKGEWHEPALLLTFLALALQSLRHTPFLGLIAAVLIGRALARPRDGADPLQTYFPPREGPVHQALYAAAILTVISLGLLRLGHLSRAGTFQQVEERAFPVGALAHLSREPLQGRLLHLDRWGGYLIWHGHEVFIDGRAEVYGEEILEDYLDVFWVRPGWQETLDRWQIEGVLARTGSPTQVLLEESPGWRKVYADQTAVLFSRR